MPAGAGIFPAYVVECCSGIEQTFDLVVGDAEDRSGVRDAVKADTAGAELGVGACTQRSSSPCGTLRRDESLAAVGVTSREHRREVAAVHLSGESHHGGGAAEPPAGLLATIRVVALRSTFAARARRCFRRRRRGLRWWLEIADDRVHDAGGVGSAAAEWGHRELHETTRAGGSTGSPEGNLSMCARRTCRLASM